MEAPQAIAQNPGTFHFTTNPSLTGSMLVRGSTIDKLYRENRIIEIHERGSFLVGIAEKKCECKGEISLV